MTRITGITPLWIGCPSSLIVLIADCTKLQEGFQTGQERAVKGLASGDFKIF